jgi:threonylcarbamoyladenosine tRNA methylthiotransferase CDKAL1
VRFFVETYGCTMNQGEGQEMQHKLVSLGHSIVPTAEDAEIVIVNTCVVIKATELKIMKRLRELREEGKQLVVTGCMAAVQETEVLGEFQEALIMPPSRYGSFAEMISERFSIGGASVDRQEAN